MESTTRRNNCNPRFLRPRQKQPQQQQQQQQQWQTLYFPKMPFLNHRRKLPYIILALSTMSTVLREYQAVFNHQLFPNMISNLKSISMSSWYEYYVVTQDDDNDDDDTAMILPYECFLSEEKMRNLSSSSSPHQHQDIRWDGSSGLNNMVGHGFGEMLLCHELEKRQQNNNNNNNTATTSATLRITFNCQKAFHEVHGATGNQLLQFYGTRLAARAFGNVDIHVHCPDAMQHKETLILPWITGYFPATTRTRKRKMTTSLSSTTCYEALSTNHPNITQTCQPFLTIPIAWAISDIRYDLRRMALSIAGLPPTDSPIYNAAWKFQNKYLILGNSSSSSSTLKPPPHQGRMDVPFTMPPPPLTNNTSSDQKERQGVVVVEGDELDDAVIHFRCGDLMSLGHPDYCFVPYTSFSQHISPNVHSIGIVTQPFQQTAWSRGVDVASHALQRCRIVVQGFQEHLQQTFPMATVRIHNSPEESLTMAYTRMILANQTFCMASTFPIFPSLATFGHAYIHVPRYNQAPTQVLLSPEPNQISLHNGRSSSNDNIHLLRDEPYIKALDLVELWRRQGQDGVLSWFRQELNVSVIAS